jgi:hypothetical protein
MVGPGTHGVVGAGADHRGRGAETQAGEERRALSEIIRKDSQARSDNSSAVAAGSIDDVEGEGRSKIQHDGREPVVGMDSGRIGKTIGSHRRGLGEGDGKAQRAAMGNPVDLFW